MIISKEETKVIGSGNITKQQFTINASAKAFKILSNNIYKDKIKAVIREYSTNALDAHILARHPEKRFLVTLPGPLDPTFKVRDYGPGLSDDQIYSIFTKYFESTKDTSNDFVGALGLGSKSAFSYTSSFTVKSYNNGVCNIYSMFMDTGEPTVSLLSTLESDEPTGLEIQIAVKPTDFNKFKETALFLYKTFKVKPILEGFDDDVLDFNTLSSSKFDGYSIIDNNDFPSHERQYVFACMGNILYPITNQVPKSFLSLLDTRNTSCIIDFKLGELDITPSREELSFDELTLQNIVNKTKLIEPTIINNYVQLVDTTNDMRDEYYKLSKLIRNSSLLNRIMMECKFKDYNLYEYKQKCESYKLDAEFDKKFKLGLTKGLLKAYDTTCYRNRNISLRTLDYYRNPIKQFKSHVYILIQDKINGSIPLAEGILAENTNCEYVIKIDPKNDYQMWFLDELSKYYDDNHLHIYYVSKHKDIIDRYIVKKDPTKVKQESSQIHNCFTLNSNGNWVVSKLNLTFTEFKNYSGGVLCTSEKNMVSLTNDNWTFNFCTFDSNFTKMSCVPNVKNLLNLIKFDKPVLIVNPIKISRYKKLSELDNKIDVGTKFIEYSKNIANEIMPIASKIVLSLCEEYTIFSSNIESRFISDIILNSFFDNNPKELKLIYELFPECLPYWNIKIENKLLYELCCSNKCTRISQRDTNKDIYDPMLQKLQLFEQSIKTKLDKLRLTNKCLIDIIDTECISSSKDRLKIYNHLKGINNELI